MRGTNYGIGFGIASFFLLGGGLLFGAGQSELIDFGTPAVGEDDPNDVFTMIGAIWAGVAVFLMLVFGGLRLRAAGRDRLAREGRPATATVRSADLTGTYINEQPVMRIVAELRGTGIPSREVTTRSIVPFTALGRWGVGTELPVRVDPEDHGDFVILWDELPLPLSQAPAAAPAPARDDGPSVTERLVALEKLRTDGLVTDAEYAAKRTEILADL